MQEHTQSMPVILLAHRDPQVRASLGSELTARGFDVIGVDSVDSALDAAAAGASALLVELTLLAEEDMEVKTRLDLRSGHATRILALTHKASAEEMSMLKRHGAGLLSRPIEDIERMATMLRIVEEPAAPWEGSGKKPAPSPAPKGAKSPKASPSGVSSPPPAPKASPSNVLAPPVPQPPPAAAEAVAPWDAAAAPPLPKAPAASPPPISPPATPSQSAFKPPPANFMPPDLSKSFKAAPAKEKTKEPPPPEAGGPAISEILEEGRFASLPMAAVPSAPAPPPTAASAGPPAWGDDTEDDIASPRMDTNVFLDEPEVATGRIGIPSEAKADPLADSAELSRRTDVSTIKGPQFEVEAEEGSTGAFAIPDRPADSLAPKKGPAAPPPPPVEEGTRVIAELASQPIAAAAPANPFTELDRDTSTSLPDLSNVAATISNDWFADSEVKRKEVVEPNGPSVLVVEDEPAFRTFLKEALGSQGYRVHTAINGPNALRYVKTTPGIDLVISDLHMPHMDGFELKHEIDKIIGRSMPFIVCTADANEEKINVAAQVGAAALVPKPIENLDAFFAIVTDTLKDAGVIARTA